MNAAALSVVVVWLVLMLSTAASTWWFSRPMFTATVSTLAVMVIAAAKVSLVMSHFMELRSAPRAWQMVGAGWVVVAASAVVILYLL